jgi:hypothetical protein
MLKKTCTTLILILLLNTFAFGFQEPEKWPTFNSPEGRFGVVMPTKPKVEVREVDSAVGKLTLYTYSSSTSAASFMASFGDYPNEVTDVAQKEAVLDGVRGGVVNGLEAELVSEEKIMIGANPGRAFTARKAAAGGTEYLFRWRIYLVGRRLYQLGVVVDKKNSAEPDSAKFLTSFQLLG